jgi:hypothetical protein
MTTSAFQKIRIAKRSKEITISMGVILVPVHKNACEGFRILKPDFLEESFHNAAFTAISVRVAINLATWTDSRNQLHIVPFGSEFTERNKDKTR